MLLQIRYTFFKEKNHNFYSIIELKIPFDIVSTRSHPWIATKVRPIPISFYVTMNKFKGGLMDADSGWYHFNSENWVGKNKQVRS
jgi:hypothetical protein